MRFPTGRQIAWIIYEVFKISGTDESVLDLNEILKVELKEYKVQTIISIPNTCPIRSATAGVMKQSALGVLNNCGIQQKDWSVRYEMKRCARTHLCRAQAED